ncbi:hypothetical protein, partial [uncultured Fibrobacter sp.]|uniref:hypothetical protein n=1 Tax=uncultured Fibrobacter sp. TaxID=261512 RepID=UPI0025945761
CGDSAFPFAVVPQLPDFSDPLRRPFRMAFNGCGHQPELAFRLLHPLFGGFRLRHRLFQLAGCLIFMYIGRTEKLLLRQKKQNVYTKKNVNDENVVEVFENKTFYGFKTENKIKK